MEKDIIKHLIEEYKELKYKYNKALSDLVKAEHKNKELEEENKKLKSSLTNTAVAHANSIDVSLVEEMIEELKKEEKELQDSISDEEREEYSDANISYGLMLIENKNEEELIEEFKKLIQLRKNKAGNITHDTCIVSTAQLETVLNLIQTQQAEIEQLKNKNKHQSKEMQKDEDLEKYLKNRRLGGLNNE